MSFSTNQTGNLPTICSYSIIDFIFEVMFIEPNDESGLFVYFSCKRVPKIV